jgi:putative protease
VGEVLEYDRQKGLLSINVKNKFGVGNSLELMTPKGNITFTLDAMESMKGEKLDVAPGDGWQVRIPAPGDIDPEYALIMRNNAG